LKSLDSRIGRLEGTVEDSHSRYRNYALAALYDSAAMLAYGNGDWNNAALRRHEKPPGSPHSFDVLHGPDPRETFRSQVLRSVLSCDVEAEARLARQGVRLPAVVFPVGCPVERVVGKARKRNAPADIDWVEARFAEYEQHRLDTLGRELLAASGDNATRLRGAIAERLKAMPLPDSLSAGVGPFRR